MTLAQRFGVGAQSRIALLGAIDPTLEAALTAELVHAPERRLAHDLDLLVAGVHDLDDADELFAAHQHMAPHVPMWLLVPPALRPAALQRANVAGLREAERIDVDSAMLALRLIVAPTDSAAETP